MAGLMYMSKAVMQGQYQVLMCKQVETSQLEMELVASLSMAEPSQTRTSNVSTLLSPCVHGPHTCCVA